MRITPTRVLIVADDTVDSPELCDAVARRAAAGPCTFTLMVPAFVRGPRPMRDLRGEGYAEAEERLEAALPGLSMAAGELVVGVIGPHDPLAAVHDALTLLGFDEIMISMLLAGRSGWRRLELPRKVRALGVPVFEVVAAEPAMRRVVAAEDHGVTHVVAAAQPQLTHIPAASPAGPRPRSTRP
jgi:hypothetical protein